MINDIPINPIRFIDNIDNLDNFFGFCLANIQTPPNMLKPILLYRNDDGHIIFPIGS
jgi:hypothetical protein